MELEQEKVKHKESAHIKEIESFRKESLKVNRENQKLHSLHDQCLRDKNQAERDLDSAIRVLNESKCNAKEKIALDVRKERASSKSLNAKLDYVQ